MNSNNKAFENALPNLKEKIMLIATTPFIFAAVEYSLIYLLLGGGFFGALVIFAVARALGR